MTTCAVNLLEWETAEPTQGSGLEGDVLAGNSAAQLLADNLTKSGCIEVLRLARGLELRASSYVGRFTLGAITVTIRPKITGAPLMNLLRYAYRLRHLDLFTEASYAAAQASFEDLLIHQLAAEASELLARGLHRDYRRTEASFASPRGRIAFASYVRVAASAGGTLPCVYHPRSEDILLNQVLQGGLFLSSRITQEAELRGRVRRLAKSFASDITTTDLDPTILSEAWHSLDRRTSAYEPALKLIHILLQTQGASLADPWPALPASGFLFDMNRFFQALLSRFLGEHLDGYELEDERTLRGMFTFDPTHNPRSAESPSLRPDFLVLRKQRIQAVLDAKYRDLWKNDLPREMLYQLALYALGQSVPERRATILYPTLEDAAREQIILVNDPLRGAAKAQVILRPVDLVRLDHLLTAKGAGAQRRLGEFAQFLAFGNQPQSPNN